MAQKKNDDGLTPMMRQFYTFKKEHPDALLLFRCGKAGVQGASS